MARTIHAIKSDPPWLADVRRKALEKGISEEAMLRLDAEYMFNQKLKKF
jgi:hypothetical protein